MGEKWLEAPVGEPGRSGAPLHVLVSFLGYIFYHFVLFSFFRVDPKKPKGCKRRPVLIEHIYCPIWHFVLFAVLGIQPRVSPMLSKQHLVELHPWHPVRPCMHCFSLDATAASGSWQCSSSFIG